MEDDLTIDRCSTDDDDVELFDGNGSEQATPMIQMATHMIAHTKCGVNVCLFV